MIGKHYGRSIWHPQSLKFSAPTICETFALAAIREGNELRERIRNKRVLEIRV